ncbi:oligosaccharide flippase family protein [Undibacterium sp. CY7W]|uniref:Oligosaccharide flippase family protein n=1 Tax=Undibacterium rugosum TaxID=2762291 RepID=A0A923I3C2_9BURK|nr:oligosaccharide flippase family protein [Undibacterium rugosum]MBC3936347.1 oligosaccharide flippase family protein [Undibacterium rugosum]
MTNVTNKAIPTLSAPSKSLGGVVRQIVNQLGVAVASKLVPIATIFLYSRMMGVADYGVLNIFQSYLWIFALVLSLNLHVAIGRYIYLPEAAFESFLGTTLLSVGAVFVVGSIAIMAFAEVTSVTLGLPQLLLPLMLVTVAGQIVESLMTQIAIHDQRGELLLRIVAGKAVVSLSLSLALLLVWGGDKFFAVLLADAFASLILSVVVLVLLRSRIEWTLRPDHLTYMARYALPLVPYMLGLTLLSQFDRVIIDRFYGKEATGLYSLSYNVGVLLLMVVTAVLNAFNPSFFTALNKGDHDRINRDARLIFALALVPTVGIVLFGQQLSSFVLPARYVEGFTLIPIVALGGLCSVVFQIWVRVLAYFHKTATISAITISCAALNIGLNLWLLPLFGWKVAAWTTVVAYFAMTVFCLGVVNVCRLLPPVMPWREALWILSVLVLVLVNMQQPLHDVLRVGVFFVVVWLVRRDLLSLMHREVR